MSEKYGNKTRGPTDLYFFFIKKSLVGVTYFSNICRPNLLRKNVFFYISIMFNPDRLTVPSFR